MSGGGALVIAAHPDDEVLGCGGVLARHAAASERVTIVIACEGRPDRRGPHGSYDNGQIHQAATALGVSDVEHLRFPDQTLDAVLMTALIDPLERIVRAVRPRVVYCQHGEDLNRDHQLLFQAALVATRPTEPSIETVYAFDTASSTEWGYPRRFAPDTWIDISQTLARKLEAMACYASEIRDYPHPRSLQALELRARAFGNQVCMDAAEVFMTVRRITRNGQALR